MEKILLELFSGSGQMSEVFRSHGWKTVTVDYNPEMKADYCMNVYDLTIPEIEKMCGRLPDVVWMSPDCTTYSKLGARYHRYKVTRTPVPKSDYAMYCDSHNRELFDMVQNTNWLWFIENPRGFMRLMDFVEGMPRYTVTYCQYGDTRRKETDIFTNHPNPRFKPVCKNGDSCHLPVGHNGKYGNGIQAIETVFERSKIPLGLCEHIYEISEEFYNSDRSDRGD